MSNRVYDFNLTASTASVVNVEAVGSYFKIRTAPGGPVAVRVDGGSEVICDAGQGMRGKAFRSLQIRNLQAIANAGSVFVGSAAYEDSRIAGEVAVIDSTRALVGRDRKFQHTMTVGTPAAGQFAIAQIFNGTANKGLALKTVGVFQSDLAGIVAVCGGVGAVSGGNTFSSPVMSKKLVATGQVAIDASILRYGRFDNPSGGIPGVPGGFANQQANMYVPAGYAQTFLPLDDGPILVGPGVGLSISHTVAASGFIAYWEGEVFDWTY